MPKPELFRRDLRETFGRKPPAEEDLEKAVRRATRAVEYLLKLDIRPRKMNLEVDLSHGCVVLDRYPIRNLEIEGVNPDLYVVDDADGLIIASLPPHMHKVSYEVGNGYDDLPVYVQELIKQIALLQLRSLEEEEREQIRLLFDTGVHLRDRIARERLAHAETLRATEGQRFMQYR